MRHENEARSNYSAALPLFTAQGLGHKAKVDRKSRLRVCFRCDGGISRGILHQTRSLPGPLLLVFFFFFYLGLIHLSSRTIVSVHFQLWRSDPLYSPRPRRVLFLMY